MSLSVEHSSRKPAAPVDKPVISDKIALKNMKNIDDLLESFPAFKQIGEAFICQICHDDVQTANTEVQASGFITFRPEEMLTEELNPRNHNEKKYNLSRQLDNRHLITESHKVARPSQEGGRI